MDNLLELEVLPQISKPARYAGNEMNSYCKCWDSSPLKFALVFPEVYELGMSNLGFQILYNLINEKTDFLCERAFAPWSDMEQIMREKGISVFTLESKKPLMDFDVIGFSLSYEMTYTNVLNILNLSKIPLYSIDRAESREQLSSSSGSSSLSGLNNSSSSKNSKNLNPMPYALCHHQSSNHQLPNLLQSSAISHQPSAYPQSPYPLIIAGGVCAYNPEPLADFFDLFVIGEGEDVVIELFDVIVKHSFISDKSSINKAELLRECSHIQGIYVPSLYKITSTEHFIIPDSPIFQDVPSIVTKRFSSNLDSSYYPVNPILPAMRIVHDRINLEIMRGCTRGCRFCQAGMIYRPLRKRSKEQILQYADKMYNNLGCEEISLLSLNSIDHPDIETILENIINKFSAENVSVALPSMRVDAFTKTLAEQLKSVRATGLTFAPEAGSQRLRDIINKQITENEIINGISKAIELGWDNIKMYFMIGLPYEEISDVENIADLIVKTITFYRRMNFHISISNFVPKVHTPFQWMGQKPINYLLSMQQNIKNIILQKLNKKILHRNLKLDFHNPYLSFLEAVLARGDRNLAKVLKRAIELGCRFDGWTECFNFDRWAQAFKDCGIEPEGYANSSYEYNTIFPWDHINCGVKKTVLYNELKKAECSLLTGDCKDGICYDCGAC